MLGTSRRSRWTELTRGSIINRVVREAKGIDVHVITAEDAPTAEGADRTLAPMRLHASPAATDDCVRFRRGCGALLGTLVARNSALDPRHAGALTSSAGLLMFLGVVVVVAASAVGYQRF